MKLHQRGVDLLVEIHTALDHLDRLSPKDVRGLLDEAEIVLRELLARDMPVGDEGESRHRGGDEQR